MSPSTAIARRIARTQGARAALVWLLVTSGSASLWADTFSEDFKGTTAPGWIFGANPGDTPPALTAASGIDAAGDGWLRLNTNTADQSTFALLDTQIFSVNANISIEMEYAFFNGSGADGITFFLVDGNINSATFSPGAYGGSMGYAQKTTEAGMPGGYLGFAFDNWGNYTNNNEGRVGGVAGAGTTPVDSTLRPNRIAVRGPESSNYAYIASSSDLSTLSGGGQMDFPTATTRPDQTGVDYRSFRLTIDANNQLTVEMKFGASSSYITAFTADLAAYERPDSFKIGFTGATGSANEIHEIRNLAVTTTPWSTGSGAYEWDNGAGTTTWGTLAGGEANNNWYSSVTAENNTTPLRDGDVLFGNKPTNNGTNNTQSVQLGNNVEVRNLTFDSSINYVVGTVGDGRVITFGDTTRAGLPSLNVNNYNGSYARHKINSDIALVEDLAIRNFSYSTLCLNGTIETNSSNAPSGNDITVSGYGAVNFNDDISGSGNLVKNGSGIATINNNNSDDPSGAPTPWIGNVTVNSGQLVLTSDGALGGSVGRGSNANRTTGATTLQFLNANAADFKVGQLVTGTGIPAGTYITAISIGGTNTTVTLSNSLTANNNSGSTITVAGATTVNTGGTLTIRPDISGAAVSYAAAETITLNGDGITRNTGQLAGALHNDGGDNTLGANVSIRLASNVSIGSRDGNLTINGVVSETGGARSLTKVGPGVVTLGNSANSYTGATIVREGALRVTAETALPGGFSSSAPSGGNLTLDGGVLEIGANVTFSRRLGAASDQVQFTGDGGFSAYGGARTVTLTNSAGTAGGALTWGAGSFVPTGNALLLSSDYANNTVTLTNAIDFGSAQREVRVANGSAAIDAALTGALSGSGGLVKTGAGTLNVGTGNTYTGATEIRAGSLRGTVSASNLQLNGGVRDVAANTSLALGTAAGEVQWTGDGGFAAVGGSYTLNLSSGAALTWGGSSPANFVGANNKLLFGSTGADNTLTLVNALDLGASGTRTIQTIQGTSTTVASGGLSGVVSGAADLAVTGNGRLDLTANNTNTGAVTITGSEVRLSGANGDLASASGYTIQQGGSLYLDNSVTSNSNRISANTVTLNGGTLTFIGRNTTESAGTLALAGGANTITLGITGARSTQLNFTDLSRSPGATVDFTTTGGTLGSTGNNPRVTFTATAPALLDDGILAHATVNGADFAAYASDNGVTPDGVSAYAGYDTGAQTGWTAATDNAAPAADQTLGAARTINSLKLASGIDVAQAGFTLTLESGGLLTTGATAATIGGGTLTTGNSNELIVHAYNTGGTTISSTLAGTGGLTKSGTGTLTLSGTAANTLTGATTVNAGTLVLAKSDNVVAVAGNITVGDGRGVDTLRLGANEQIADTATVTLKGGAVGNAANVARLELNGASAITDSSRVETFNTLSVTGNSVLDFGGGSVCSPTFLYLDFLTVAADSVLTITNWLEFTDFLLVKKSTFDESQLARIIFDGYPGNARFQSYDGNYWQITPVPEPASYGALAFGGLAASLALRRKRRAP